MHPLARRFALAVLALPLVTLSPATAADLVRCPAAIDVKQQLTVPVPGWSAGSDGLPHNLAGLTFYDGKPEEMAALAPDKEVKAKGKLLSTWSFAGGTRPLWVTCHYAGTGITLERQLPKTRACTVTYKSDVTLAGLPVIEAINCR